VSHPPREPILVAGIFLEGVHSEGKDYHTLAYHAPGCAVIT